MELEKIQKAKKKMDYELSRAVLKIVAEFTHLTGLSVSGIEFDSCIHYHSLRGTKRKDEQILVDCKGVVKI